MKGKTVAFEFHAYKGIGRIGGDLKTAFCLGWVSVSYFPFLLSAWLRSRTNALRNAINSDHVPEPPKETMACWGDKPMHRVVRKGRT